MKRLIRAFAIIFTLTLCFTLMGCASSSERTSVRESITGYFEALQKCDFQAANEMCALDDDTLATSDIEKCALNEYIFKKIEFNLVALGKDKDGTLYADVTVTQLSLYKAYAASAEEYSEYVRTAEKEGKSFSEEALKEKFDSIMLNNLKNDGTMVSERVRVYISEEGKIKMTAEFRNALFGGELDAINYIQNIK